MSAAAEGLAARADCEGGPRDFGPRLVAWQKSHGRLALPWQQRDGGRDAYRVWLAEIMLQQTRVAAAIPYFERFVARFPDVHALAAASLDDVLLAWSGLGYYSRARNLHRAARLVVERHGGAFPTDPLDLEGLPGVGRSTAAAIAAFAFGRRAAILDGNVKRVLCRAFAVNGPADEARVARRLWALAEGLLPGRDIERYTQGLMDLGATVCTPRNPSCLACPFAADCRARLAGRVDELPARRVRRASPQRTGTFLWVVHGDELLIERRPAAGVWGGLWSLPELDEPDDATYARASDFGDVTAVEPVDGFTHAFTHFTLVATVLRVELSTRRRTDEDHRRWIPLSRHVEFGMPAPIRRLVADRLAATA